MQLFIWLMWLGYYLALMAVLFGGGWTFVLYGAGNRYVRELAQRPPGRPDDFLWVFFVPALNEAVTIADSVNRLRAVKAKNLVVIVINDGSDDGTGEVLANIGWKPLIVLTRVLPNARKGKAEALDDAFSFLLNDVLQRKKYRKWQPDQVIVGIVDADGRLDANAPAGISRHFALPRVGGVQVNVQIYNQTSYLTRMQGLEFKVFGGLYQNGRSHWGAAFMGGNGQFNRLSALQSIATEQGPWSNYLTEDQELGLRLLARGWLGEQCPNTFVDQQGLNNLRRLFRQPARWMQGNLQVVRHPDRLHAHHLVGIRRVDALLTLFLPIMTLIVSTAVVVALFLWIFLHIPFLPLSQPLLMVVLILLAVGPVSASVMVLARGKGFRGLLIALRNMPPYVAYTFLMWPVAFRGLFNLMRGKQGWAKTAREAIVPAPAK
ncbi:MAG: glycosyltransferase family 2 protein [Candidatus Nanopelagicales bacterium]|nr:glycosyltransferase family 2 protein [Candidatus Nanopelagicales bacterium]